MRKLDYRSERPDFERLQKDIAEIQGECEIYVSEEQDKEFNIESLLQEKAAELGIRWRDLRICCTRKLLKANTGSNSPVVYLVGINPE